MQYLGTQQTAHFRVSVLNKINESEASGKTAPALRAGWRGAGALLWGEGGRGPPSPEGGRWEGRREGRARLEAQTQSSLRTEVGPALGVRS